MKLQLRQDKGIDILSLEGAIESVQPSVIRDGVTKLLRNGKHRIVLDLSKAVLPAGGMPAALVLALSELDQVARDLSGRVVLCGVAATVTKTSSIDSFDDAVVAVASFLPPRPITEKLEAVGTGPKAETASETLQRMGEEIRMLRGLLHKWTLHRHVSSEPSVDALKIQALEKKLADLEPQVKK